MSSFRYRAFLSYSHQDEAWAVWVHRALESYRLPRKLVGKPCKTGIVPARVQPVFRDRDDLPTSSHLADSVKQALKDSESLIVICSPAACQSRWVNEEIREFAQARGAERILCLVVDGDPAGEPTVDGCFPIALSEIGINEPLAADARKWADGKHLAKLKLVAGMLGIRLDELRQRDLQRQRKQRFVFGLGVIAALALTVSTITSRISEQNERDKAEQLATFVVDLGERLKSDADLETLALISSEAAKSLQRLDQNKLSANTKKKVSLALRQMGWVSQLQGKPQAAMDSFVQSRDILQQLLEAHPQNTDFQFELGNAEYYIGNIYFLEGRYDLAKKHMELYYQGAEKLVAAEPQNADWIMELSYAHNNLAAVQLDSGQGIDADVFKHVDEAVRLVEKVVELRPDDPAIADGYATVLAWAADAQLQACNLEQAAMLRNQVEEVAATASKSNPANNSIQSNWAFALTGLGRVQRLAGDTTAAEQNFVRAIAILEQLSKADPSNMRIYEDYIDRRVMLLELQVDTGKLHLAKSGLEQLASVFKSKEDGSMDNAYLDYLVVAANFEIQTGNNLAASGHLKRAAELQTDRNDSGQTELNDGYRSAMIEYLWWEIHGNRMTDHLVTKVTPSQEPEHQFQSCREAHSDARMMVINGDKSDALKEVNYLLSKGYADPAFMNFCRKQNLCAIVS